MKWLLKISYSWGDEEPYQEFNSFEEAWAAAKSKAVKEAEVESIEAASFDETDNIIGLAFSKDPAIEHGRITLCYLDGSFCYYDVLPQEITDTDCIRQPEKADAIKISMEGGSLAMENPS